MTPELIVFFAAMTPFVELKLAIPLGAKLGLSIPTTFLFSTMGTILPAVIGLAIATPVVNFLRKNSKYMDRFFEKLFDKTRKEHSKKFNRSGALFLITFVAIPLPGSGSVSGAVIAFIFGIDYWRAISLISLGTIIAATLLIAGFNSIFGIISLFT